MLHTKNISILGRTLLLSLLLVGCVHNVPLAVDPNRDITQALPNTKKIPAKVGIYLSDDLKKYVYKQQKMGMTFQMNIGESLPPISMQMVSAMFEDVVIVNSLPPYSNDYKPDVEAVIRPAIIYCYGNAIGTVTGHIEAKLKMRIKAYDLSGRAIWQDEAMGESRSRELNFVGTFLGGMEEVGKTGYEAAFAAAVRIIRDFNARPPKELYSLLEIKNIASLKNRRSISNFDAFRKYYEKGQMQYERNNFYQAIYSFEKANSINPDDLSTLFYMGACYSYTGAKDKALEIFNKVVGMNPNSQEAKDSRKWIDILKEPLKISVVSLNLSNGGPLRDAMIRKALGDSRMYEIIEVTDLKSPANIRNTKKLNQFLDKCYKRGIRIVIFDEIDDSTQKAKIEQYTAGDLATECQVKTSAKVYSTKKKELKFEITISEKGSVIGNNNEQEEMALRQDLLLKGAEKLVLRLLEHDIY